ncbi:MAG TPA: helix-turn-helix domain-containing protein [Methylobacter sp.]|jgi:transposase
MSVKPIELTENEQEQLKIIIRKGSDWRARDRAETILMLSEGQTVFSVAEKQVVMPEAIRERRRRWLKNGLSSLPDQPRSGAPSKLNEDHRALLKEWMDAEPLTCRVLVNRLETECDISISASTLRNELKRLGYVWKRTRYSLKKIVIPSVSSKPSAKLPN